MLLEPLLILAQLQRMGSPMLDLVRRAKCRMPRVSVRSLENRQPWYQLGAILAGPGIEVRKQKLMQLKHGLVGDVLAGREQENGVFQAGFKGQMLHFLDLCGVFELEDITQVTCGFKIVERIEHHALIFRPLPCSGASFR
ncbi:hypothetical protein D3C77_550150 [compost metagenome]